MKTHNVKTLVPGYKVGEEFRGKTLIAVPAEKRMRGDIIFAYNGTDTMPIPSSSTPLKKLKFKDKFGPGEYELEYFEWAPQRLEMGKDYAKDSEDKAA